MRALLAVVLVVAVGVSGAVAQAPAPVNLAFATLDTGSAWYVYGATMAELLRKTLPPGLEHRREAARGRRGQPAPGGQERDAPRPAFTVTNRWAFEGKEAYTEKLDNLRGLVGGFDTYYLVAMATKKLGITSVRELRDKKLPVRIYTQPVGSLGEFAGRQLLRATGLAYNDIKGFGGSTQHVGYNVIIDAFKDGRADILFAVVTPKHPSVSEIVSSVDVEFLGLDAGHRQGAAAARLHGGHHAARHLQEPVEAGQHRRLPHGAHHQQGPARADRLHGDEDRVENKDALVRGHGGLADFDPRTAWQPDKVGIPLHPGAERAYREKGWMK